MLFGRPVGIIASVGLASVGLQVQNAPLAPATAARWRQPAPGTPYSLLPHIVAHLAI